MSGPRSWHLGDQRDGEARRAVDPIARGQAERVVAQVLHGKASGVITVERYAQAMPGFKSMCDG